MWADAAGLCAGQQGRQQLGPLWPWPPHGPAQAIPAAARYLVDHGAHSNLDRSIYGYNHSRSYVARVKQLARRYARGGGRR